MNCVRKRDGYSKYYLFKTVNRRRLSICLNTGDRKVAERKARLLITAAEEQRWDVIRSALNRDVQASATIDKICDVYLDAVQRLGVPEDWVARRNLWALKRLIEISGVSCGHDARVLNGDLIVKFSKKMLDGKSGDELKSAKRTVASYLRQARSIFTPALMEEYRSLHLPDVTSFRNQRGTIAPKVDDRPFTADEVNIIRTGSELKATMPALYPIWFLGYYLGLRRGEIVQARPSWLRKHEITEQDRVSGEWLRDRSFVWVMDLDDPSAKLKTEHSRGSIPVADDVAEDLLRLSEGREYFVPGATLTDRKNLAGRQFGLWLKGKGWTRRKKVQELRRYRYQVWTRMYGKLYGEMWCRRSIQGVSQFYDSALYLSRRPLTMNE